MSHVLVLLTLGIGPKCSVPLEQSVNQPIESTIDDTNTNIHQSGYIRIHGAHNEPRYLLCCSLQLASVGLNLILPVGCPSPSPLQITTNQQQLPQHRMIPLRNAGMDNAMSRHKRVRYILLFIAFTITLSSAQIHGETAPLSFATVTPTSPSAVTPAPAPAPIPSSISSPLASSIPISTLASAPISSPVPISTSTPPSTPSIGPPSSSLKVDQRKREKQEPMTVRPTRKRGDAKTSTDTNSVPSSSTDSHQSLPRSQPKATSVDSSSLASDESLATDSQTHSPRIPSRGSTRASSVESPSTYSAVGAIVSGDSISTPQAELLTPPMINKEKKSEMKVAADVPTQTIQQAATNSIPIDQSTAEQPKSVGLTASIKPIEKVQAEPSTTPAPSLSIDSSLPPAPPTLPPNPSVHTASPNAVTSMIAEFPLVDDGSVGPPMADLPPPPVMADLPPIESSSPIVSIAPVPVTVTTISLTDVDTTTGNGPATSVPTEPEEEAASSIGPAATIKPTSVTSTIAPSNDQTPKSTLTLISPPMISSTSSSSPSTLSTSPPLNSSPSTPSPSPLKPKPPTRITKKPRTAIKGGHIKSSDVSPDTSKLKEKPSEVLSKSLPSSHSTSFSVDSPIQSDASVSAPPVVSDLTPSSTAKLRQRFKDRIHDPMQDNTAHSGAASNVNSTQSSLRPLPIGNATRLHPTALVATESLEPFDGPVRHTLDLARVDGDKDVLRSSSPAEGQSWWTWVPLHGTLVIIIIFSLNCLRRMFGGWRNGAFDANTLQRRIVSMLSQVSQGTILDWYKKVGDRFDAPLSNARTRELASLSFEDGKGRRRGVKAGLGTKSTDQSADIEMQSLTASLASLHIPKMIYLETNSLVDNPNPKTLLTAHFLELLLPYLPATSQIQDLALRYSLSVCGASITDFYRRVSKQQDTITVIQDSAGYIFGCYASSPWRIHDTYYGSGHCFVFTLHPNFQVYPCSNVNSFYQLASRDSIAIGGGDHFALWLDEAFRKGQSKSCQTFNSPSLSSEEEFRCHEMEVWSFVESSDW